METFCFCNQTLFLNSVCVFSNLLLISCSDKEMRVQQQHRVDLSRSFLFRHVLCSSHVCNMFHPERGLFTANWRTRSHMVQFVLW